VRNKAVAGLSPKVKGSHDYHFVNIKPSLTLPNPSQREFPSLGGDSPKPLNEPLLNGNEIPLGN